MLRGGFTGAEDSADERAPGAVSVIDGDSRFQCMRIYNHAKLTIERVEFRNGYPRAVLRGDAPGDLVVEDCGFYLNGATNAADLAGCALYFYRNYYGTANLAFRRCRFEGNGRRFNSTAQLDGGCIYLNTSQKSLVVEDSLFLTNGAPFSAEFPSVRPVGSCICSINTPVTIARCRFAGNRSCSYKTDNKGGVIYLSGTCGGSCISNCAFVANEDVSRSSAAGLSSSSALVVATAEAVVALNSLHVSDREFIERCGEGEWFVGSRGGFGDHAAMKYGRPGRLVHLGFHPFEVGESASLPDDYAVIIADSTLKARKSEGSKDRFNAQVAAYDLSLLMLKQTYPDANLTDLRSLAAVRPYSRLYEMLRSLPLSASRKQLEEALPDDLHKLARLFASHADPGAYNLRGVILYGLSEMERSERFMETLKNGAYDLVGKMMRISHNGDRIGDPTISDDFLKEQAANDADLAFQCGAYACSVPQIDELCDLLDSTPGVLGSELVGAGLGGCIVALVKKDQAENIINVLNEKYYAKYGVGTGHANVYQPSQGSSVEF